MLRGEVGTRHAAAVIGVARQLQMLDDAFEIVRAGGVHTAGCLQFDDAFTTTVARGVPRADVLVLDMPSVFGSAVLAIELLGDRVDADAAHDALGAAHVALPAAPIARRSPSGTTTR